MDSEPEYQKEDDKEVLLITATDEMQANMIETLLEKNNIPVMIKRKEAGSYLNIYMGMNSYGIEIYVPSKLQDAAKELINEMAPENEASEPDEEFEAEMKLYRGNQSAKAWILIFLFVPGLAVAVIALGIKLLSFLD